MKARTSCRSTVFWIREAGFEPFPDLAQRGQTELFADRVPELRWDAGTIWVSWHR